MNRSLKIVKALVPPFCKRAVKEHLGVPSLHWSLQNLKRKGFHPAVIIDVGAYEGFWTTDVLEVFPDASVLMVEAQKKKEPCLEAIKRRFPNTDYAMELLSAKDNEEKFFFENETGSHVTETKENSTTIVKSLTLDTLLYRKGFPYPDLLKLDVQGHEKEVLLGAERCLERATVCLLELSLLNIGGNTPLLAEMIRFMDGKGYQAYDISQFIRRPFDKALYQVDMFFAKKDSFLTGEQRW